MVLQPDMIQSKYYRIESLFTRRWLQFALPHSNAMPAHSCQLLLFLFISLLVPAYLSYPKITIRLRDLTTCRTLHFAELQKMPMPETAVNKDASPVFSQYQIWMPGQSLVVKPISESSRPQSASHNHFWLSVLRANARHTMVSLSR